MQTHMHKQQAGERDRRAARVAGRYRGLVRENFRDPIGEIAHIEKIPEAAVTRYLRLAGQPYARRNVQELNRRAVIEEVQFFRSLGRGSAEIAEKVGMTETQLAVNLRAWKTRGDHDMDLEWLDMYFMADQHKNPTRL